jgi:hypothetical protein
MSVAAASRIRGREVNQTREREMEFWPILFDVGHSSPVEERRTGSERRLETDGDATARLPSLLMLETQVETQDTAKRSSQ